MAWHRRPAAPHGWLRHVLLLILTLSLVIAALPFGTGTHAWAQSHARAQVGPVTPRVVFHENFENNIGSTPVNLQNYVGADGQTYTADPEWLPLPGASPNTAPFMNCNGVIINYNMTANPSNCNDTPNGYDATGMQALRALADALGSFQGNGQGNNALAAYTDTGAPYPVDPGCTDPDLPERRAPNQTHPPAPDFPFYQGNTTPVAGACTTGRVQFETLAPIDLPTGSSGHSITFGVNVATINCPTTGETYTHFDPLLRFRLTNANNSSQTVDVNGTDPINPCTDQGVSTQTITVTLPQNPPEPFAGTINARVGTYQRSVPIPSTWTQSPSGGTSFYLEMINDQANGWGNDSAIDNIEVLDTTQQLSKSFSPASLPAGSASTLTFTVSNTTDEPAQPAWSFTETLPPGLRVAEPPDVVNNCGGTITAPSGSSGVTSGSDSIYVSGTGLAAGQASCTVSINVTAPYTGTYQNTPGNITGNVEVLAPTDTTSVTFTEPGILCFTVYPTAKTLPSVTVGLHGGVTEDSLGTITVWDDRAEQVAGWTVTVTSTDFATTGASPAGTIPASDATYTAGQVTTTGTITVTDHTPITLSNAAQNILTATGSGINLASWNPQLSISVPATAVPGAYSGMITHSVF